LLEKESLDSYCLGIESTADDFGAAVVSFKGEVLSNANDAYLPKEGGIHPREAARHHAEVSEKVLTEALFNQHHTIFSQPKAHTRLLGANVH